MKRQNILSTKKTNIVSAYIIHVNQIKSLVFCYYFIIFSIISLEDIKVYLLEALNFFLHCVGSFLFKLLSSPHQVSN